MLTSAPGRERRRTSEGSEGASHEARAHAAWKEAVLGREIVLEDLDTTPYDLYSHQNEDIVRESPEQLKARMAAKDAAKAAAGGND